MEAIAEIGMAIDPEDLELTSRFLKTFVNRVEVSDDEAIMFYSMPLPNTVKTANGYVTTAPIRRGVPEILLEQSAPSEPVSGRCRYWREKWGPSRRCITWLPCVWNQQIFPLLLWLWT